MVSPAPLPPANPAASFHLQTLYERLCYYLDQLRRNIVMCWHTAPPTFLPTHESPLFPPADVV